MLTLTDQEDIELINLLKNESLKYKTRLSHDGKQLNIEYGCDWIFGGVDINKLSEREPYFFPKTENGMIDENEHLFNCFLDIVYYSVNCELTSIDIDHDGMYRMPRMLQKLDEVETLKIRGSRIWEVDFGYLPPCLTHFSVRPEGNTDRDVMWQVYRIPAMIQFLVLPGIKDDDDWPPLPYFEDLKTIDISADRDHRTDGNYEEIVIRPWLRKYPDFIFDHDTYTIFIESFPPQFNK